MVRTTSLAYWKIMKHRFEMTNIEPSYDHHMTIILPTGIAGGAGTKAGVGLFLWNEQISKRLLPYLYNLKTCWRWWVERKFQKRERHSQQQQDIAQGWGFRSWSKRFLNFKFTNHPIEGTFRIFWSARVHLTTCSWRGCQEPPHWWLCTQAKDSAKAGRKGARRWISILLKTYLVHTRRSNEF